MTVSLSTIDARIMDQTIRHTACKRIGESAAMTTVESLISFERTKYKASESTEMPGNVGGKDGLCKKEVTEFAMMSRKRRWIGAF